MRRIGLSFLILIMMSGAAFGASSDYKVTNDGDIYSRKTAIKSSTSNYWLWLTESSILTANRTLTFTTGDASRTITLTGNPILSGQDYSTTGSPTFADKN